MADEQETVGYDVWEYACHENMECAIPVDTILCLYAFCALAIICEDYLVPSVEELCRRNKIPEEVAGASFVAFATSSPEIMVNVAATRHGTVEMSLSCIMGSAIIGFVLIPGLCAFFVPPGGVELSTWALMRDTGCFGISLAMIYFMLQDSQLDIHECQALTGFFVFYMCLVYSSICCCASKGDGEYSSIPSGPQSWGAGYGDVCVSPIVVTAQNPVHHDSKDVAEKTGSYQQKGSQGGSASSHEEGDEKRGVSWYLMKPLRVLLSLTMPNPSTHPDYYGLTFFLAMVWVTACTEVVLTICEELALNLNMTHELMGVTLVALGTSVPDAIASVILTQHGMLSGALCNAIGSQVINISLGVGLPFLIYDSITGKSIHIDPGNVQVVMALLFLSVSLFFALVFVPSCFNDNAGKSLSDDVEVDLEIPDAPTPPTGPVERLVRCQVKPKLHSWTAYVFLFMFFICNVIFFIQF
jgi:K+-dependent Na+/Ca+ exchanger-like protein